MTQNLKKFLDEVMRSEQDKDKLERIVGMQDKNAGMAELLAMAEGLGVILTAEDFSSELADEDLKNVAGGRVSFLSFFNATDFNNFFTSSTAQTNSSPQKNYY